MKTLASPRHGSWAWATVVATLAMMTALLIPLAPARAEGTDKVTSVPLTVTHAGEATIVAAVTTIGGEVTAVTGGDLEWTRMTGYTHDGVATSYWTADTDQPVTDLVVTAQLDDESTTSTIAITVT